MIDKLGDIFVFKVIPIMAVVITVVVAITLPVILYNEFFGEMIELKKNEWICTESVQSQSTSFIKSGDMLIPLTATQTNCTNWRRK